MPLAINLNKNEITREVFNFGPALKDKMRVIDLVKNEN